MENAAPQPGMEAPAEAADEASLETSEEQEPVEQHAEDDNQEEDQPKEAKKKSKASEQAANFSKLRTKVKSLESELAPYRSESFQQEMADWNLIKEWVQGGTERLQQLQDLIFGQAKNAAPEKDPYEGWDESSKPYLQKIDQQERELQQLKQYIQQQESTRMQQNLHQSVQVNDQTFDELMIADGFYNADGEPVDAKISQKIEDLVLTTLHQMEDVPEDIRFATPAQVKAAYHAVKDWMRAVEKRGLSKAAQRPMAPATGSRQGLPPVPSKGKQTEQDRIRGIIEMIPD